MRYSLYPATFNGGALLLGQVASLSHRTGRTVHVVRPGGSLDPKANVLSSGAPVASIMTHDLATVLATVSLTAGYDCSSSSQLNFQQRAVAGAFTNPSTTAHVTQVIEQGFLNIAEISASSESDDPAQIMLEFAALSSTGANPITDANNSAINGQPVPDYGSVFFHGPAYFGATLLTGCMGHRVRPGLVYKARRPDGAVFPVRGASSIEQRQPIIELDFLNLARIKANMDNFILNLMSDTVAVYFRKGTTSPGGRVADGTAQHIKISAAAGSWGPDDISVQDVNDATFRVTIMPTGTLALSTASTIP